jgi:serine protease Do
MTLVAFPAVRRSALRTALLGAAAAATIGGLGLADLAAGSSAALAAESAGPASFADIVDRVKGAVVSVKVKLADSADDDAGGDSGKGLPFPPGSPMEKFWRRFGLPMPDDDGPPGRGPHEHLSGQGSGFFISADGYVVTNNHVIEHATEVTVTSTDGKTLPAKVIGADPKTDLALLKVEGDSFPSVSFAAKAPRVGDWVIAVGNPFGLGGTVTAGIVSARGRDIGSGPYDDFIQIDAPVNHGNSGGPTFNSEGQVVGVNTAIFSPSGGSVGIGFAIASDVVQSVVQQLKDKGSVSRGWLGVEIQPVTPDIADSLGVKPDTGALVAKETAGSPALSAGVKVGDVIEAVDGAIIADPKDLARRIAAFGPKKAVSLTLMRDGKEQKIDVTLGVMPTDRALQEASDASPEAGEDSATGVAKLGLELEAAKGGGVKIVSVSPDSPAAEHGLEAGDVIVDAGGKQVSAPGEVASALDLAKSAGHKSVLLRVKSNESVRFVALPLKKAS